MIDTISDVVALIRSGDFPKLQATLLGSTPQELAAILCRMRADDQVVAFRILPRRLAATVFEYLPPECQRSLVKAMGHEDVAVLLNTMAPDDRTLFLSELPANATKQMLALLTAGERAEAVTLLGYGPRTVGRLMTPHYVAVKETWTVQEVLDYVREHGENSETLNIIYVVDDAGVLIDDIRIRDFLVVPLTARVSDLMDRRYVALEATDTQESAVVVFRREDRSALPVTDTAGILIGIVTVDDALDVAEATATRAFHRFGGSEAFDEPYLRLSPLSLVKKRAGWLVVLFLGEMLTATAMGFFEQEIARAVVLALFVPLIISSGGNAGSQASTLVIRALAVGELALGDSWPVIRREVLSGLTLGCILGVIGFLRISIWSSFSTIYGPHWLLVATTVAVALVGVVLWGSLVGCGLPFLLRRLGFDPATSSAPFVATLVDVTGLVIYFSVALLVLRGTLL
jgi:magnesium transporter